MQYDQNYLGGPLVPIFTKGGANNGPNRPEPPGIAGFSATIDTTNHRLFLADPTNNRILVHTLNGDNAPTNRLPANVLGQPDFAATQSGMNSPKSVGEADRRPP